MRLLIDTHVAVWSLGQPERLSKRARSLLENPEHSILVSSASVWEIATKFRLGKLSAAAEIVANVGAWFHRFSYEELAISSAHALKAGLWDSPHRDPFDRLLAAQSELESLPLVTADPAFAGFEIQTLW